MIIVYFLDRSLTIKSHIQQKKRGERVRKVITHHLRNVNVVCRLLHDRIPSSCHLQIHTKYAVTMGPKLKYILQGVVSFIKSSHIQAFKKNVVSSRNFESFFKFSKLHKVSTKDQLFVLPLLNLAF